MKILGAIFRRSGRRIQKYTDAISAAIDEDDQEALRENICALLMYLGTSREIPFRMDGIMVIHQFEIDYDGDCDPNSRIQIIKNLQQQMDRLRPRYSHLCKENRPPMIYDVKPTGSYAITVILDKALFY